MILRQGEILFRQGDEGRLYRLNKGLLKVIRLQSDGSPLLFNLLSEGELFPHHSLLSPQPCYGTAIAMTDSDVTILPAKDWYNELEQYPEKYREVALSLQNTLRGIQQRVGFLTAPTAERIPLLRNWLHQRFSEASIEQLLTQEEIGQLLGLTRETVNRWLRKERNTM
ncbi:Crp/Fnr family transcriptional regulator [Marininema halotolerans]|uniref:CRP/FNR family transcriptional regulator, anaerobic regulatory protein n=1 Tax=Marininema halotolerans TaxID=1155944 RepID=A0A1I6RIZ3_9BACL|nr:Crp/Fnr family transcriptional regulator [Marininema halotolerans]SFS64560.1 CRP/FNR family transcriptional regulator, anaerobic regulatory protein [Marininema halotolerans]